MVLMSHGFNFYIKIKAHQIKNQTEYFEKVNNKLIHFHFLKKKNEITIILNNPSRKLE